MKISVCMPVYNMADVVVSAMESILAQDYPDFEVCIADDGSTDNLEDTIRSFGDSRIKYRRFENAGYCKALARAVAMASPDSEVLFLMGADDILARGFFGRIVEIFTEHPEVGAVTRPFYWFHEDPTKAVRAHSVFNEEEDAVISVEGGSEAIFAVFHTLGQLSGLALRKKWIELGFDYSEDVFTSHIYPFASIFRSHPVVMLKDYPLAVRIGASQTIRISSIYERSPLQSWIDMFRAVFADKKFQEIREELVRSFAAKNFVGLLQIKNYGRFTWFLRESWLLVKYNPVNLIDPRFWFLFLGTLIVPKFILVRFIYWYKEKVSARGLRNVRLGGLRGTQRDSSS